MITRFRKGYSAVTKLQINGQVKAVKKTLKQNLKTRLESYKGTWPEKLPKVLWAYRTTTRTPTGETLFSLAFGHEAMIPVEISIWSLRREQFQTDRNNKRLREKLEFIDEKCEQAMMRNTTYKQHTAHYFEKRVKESRFKVGDLVLRRVFLNTREIGVGTLGATWEGPYKIAKELRPRTYRLAMVRGSLISGAWNIDHLKKYYQ